VTKAQREARKAVKAWCAKRKMRLLSAPRHVYPVAYVVSVDEFSCIVSQPWIDAEPQVREHMRKFPRTIIQTFDQSLRAGDWCITAYVCELGNQHVIAIPQRQL
jgi:hypothetical protein